MIAALPPVRDCADATRLAETLYQPTDPGARVALAALAAELERVAAENSIGSPVDVAGADALVARARALGWAPETARALEVAGEAHWLAGHNTVAIARMRDAAIEAGRARDDEAAARDVITAAMWLANSGQPAEALTVAGDAEILVLHAGDPGRLRAALLGARGVALGLLSRLDEAKQDFTRAVVAGRSDPAHDELAIAEILREAAYIERITNGYERAKALIGEAQRIFIARLGPEHPRVAITYLDLGSVFTQLGDLTTASSQLGHARALLERFGTDSRALAGVAAAEAQILLRQGHIPEALARYRDVYARLSRLAPDQPETYQALYMVSATLQQQGKWAEALALGQQVVDYRVRAFGEDSTLVASALDAVAICSQALDDYPKAIATRQRSLAIRERALGPDNADVALALEGLAGIAMDREDCAEVLRLTRRSLEIHDKVHSPDVAKLDALDWSGSCEARTGHFDEGRATLEHALALADRPGVGRPSQRAGLRVDLGGVLWDHGDHARGRKLVQEAYDLDKSVGDDGDLADLAKWLASHH
jgi:tetratricopeptide (TPR) repeat protein